MTVSNKKENDNIETIKLDPGIPGENYYQEKEIEDLVPNSSLSDTIDSDQHKEILKEVRAIENRTKESGLSPQYHERLNEMVREHVDVFHVGLSA